MKQWLGPQIKRPFIVIIGIIRITILRYMIHIIILIVITETYETVVGSRNKNTLHLSYILGRVKNGTGPSKIKKTFQDG